MVKLDFELKIQKTDFKIYVKDTRRKKVPTNKTPVLRKSTKMDIWIVGTLNQLLIRGP